MNRASENLDNFPEKIDEILRKMLETASKMIFAIDPQGHFLYTDKNWTSHIGYNEDEARAISFFDLIHPEDLAKAKECVLKIFSESEFCADDVRIVLRDGSTRYLNLNLATMHDSYGKVMAGCAIAKDVTEHHQLVEKLRNSEEKYRSIVENSPDILYTVGTEWKLLTMNKATKSVLGYEPEELLGQDFMKFISPKAAQQMIDDYSQIIAGKKIFSETVVTRKDGTECILDFVSVPLIRNGEVAEVQGIARDVTERRINEELLRNSEAKLNSIVSAIPDMLFHINRNGDLIGESMGHNKRFAWDRGTLTGKNLRDLLGIDYAENMIDGIESALDTGKLVIQECKVPSQFDSGTETLYEARIVPLKVDEVIVVARDITERKKSEEQIQQFQEQLHSLSRQLAQTEEIERRQLAVDLHDMIGQSLAAIKIKLNTLALSSPLLEKDDDVKEILSLLDSAIKNTRSLTFDLSPTVLYELGLEAGLEFLLEKFQERHSLQYEYENDGQDKPLDENVSILLYRIVSELLMNVVKHAKAERARLSIKLSDNDQVEITVEDDGQGFKLSNIKEKQEGFGLFSIRERLSWIGGTFNINTSPGSGTEASITVPLIRQTKKEQQESHAG